jgi:hypothetical protein
MQLVAALARLPRAELARAALAQVQVQVQVQALLVLRVLRRV